jgi:hypothetical protein
MIDDGLQVAAVAGDQDNDAQWFGTFGHQA